MKPRSNKPCSRVHGTDIVQYIVISVLVGLVGLSLLGGFANLFKDHALSAHLDRMDASLTEVRRAIWPHADRDGGIQLSPDVTISFGDVRDLNPAWELADEHIKAEVRMVENLVAEELSRKRRR